MRAWSSSGMMARESEPMPQSRHSIEYSWRPPSTSHAYVCLPISCPHDPHTCVNETCSLPSSSSTASTLARPILTAVHAAHPLKFMKKAPVSRHVSPRSGRSDLTQSRHMECSLESSPHVL
eukprot:Amastigsp_a843758_1151.p2 type:complete len:121 gc:universal Amastigsp_a843758_1151:366-4(-)